MRNRILKAAVTLALCVPMVATAQTPNRVGSWEFGVGGGVLMLDNALRDFLGSGTPESRFMKTADGSRTVPMAEARLGYNFNEHVGVSVGGAMATGAGVTYLTPSGSITFTGNINNKTSPFLIVGTGLTRIDGENDRRTHSTWGAHAGVGFRRMVTSNAALRLEGRLNFAGYKEVPMAKSTTMNPMVNLGFTWFTGGRKVQVAVAPRVDTIRTVRVDTLRTVRRDTIRTVRVDTVTRAATYDTDQVILRVQFRTDRAELLAISHQVLDTVAAAIRATPNSRWQVEGHTDSVGTDAYNKTLSRARAQSVVDYLVSKGVDRGIMTVEGFGFDRQVFSNTTAEGRAQNRRVQLRRIPPAPAVRVP